VIAEKMIPLEWTTTERNVRLQATWVSVHF
jgi:hypothetical protein